MSLSFLRRGSVRAAGRVAALLPVSVAFATTSALAAEVYYQPAVILTAENDTNLDLDPGGNNSSVQGYLANVGTVIGIATPTFDATIRPRLEYRDYPKSSGNNRLEEYLNFRSDYRWQRSDASIDGIIDHRDDFNAELNNAVFDPINPVTPTNPSTGKTVTGLTRTSVLILPKYNYHFTPTIGAGFSGTYQHINYTPSNATFFVDFDYYLARAFVSWNLNPKTEFEFGGYGSKYDATQVVSRATGAAATFDANTNWTQLFSTSLSVIYQHTNFETALPTLVRSQSNAWGATVNAVYKAQASQFRVNAGRTLTPSGGGGLYVNDQVQFQYDRNLTERLTLTGAVVALRNHGLSPGTVNFSRDYLQTAINMKYMIRRTWFVQGGYQYARQKFQTNPDSAVNNRVYISFGYQGLGRQY